MKVLIVKQSGLGDVVMSLPVAMAIRGQVPRARIDWLVEEPFAELLQNHPAIDRVLVSPRRLLARDLWGGLRSFPDFLRRLRSTRYDYVLDLQGLIKSASFVALSRGVHKVGFSGCREPLAALSYNLRLPPYDIERHALERYLDVLEAVGVRRPARPEFGLKPGHRELDQASSLLAGWGTGQPLVLFHPRAAPSWPARNWPPAHWARLARSLCARGSVVAITGSREDRPATAEIVRRAEAGPALRDLAGRTSLGVLAALQSLARVVVSVDTGAMHLAAAMGTPVVGLFGPTAQGRTGAHGWLHLAQRVELDCAPCLKRECPDPRCLTLLQPAKVLEELAPFIEP